MNSHQAQLAVLTPRWGAPSETFIRRHLTDICPGQTVAITGNTRHADWMPHLPRLPLRDFHETPPEALARALGFFRCSRRARALHRWIAQYRPQAFLGEWLDFSARWFPVLRPTTASDQAQEKNGTRNMGGGRGRFVAHAHGYDVSASALQSNARLYRRLHLMDAIVTVSHLARSRLLAALDLPPDKIHVIPCGVDIPPPIQRHAAPTVTILCVARFAPKKGHCQTLQAFAAARQSCPNLRLECIGDGRLLPDCRQLAAELQIADAVTFHGTQSPDFVAQRLAAADIFALHSLTAPNGDEEGLPVALLEAMAHGLPVVSTQHAGIPEAVDDGITGFLVPELDTRAMADRFITLAQNPGRRAQFGAAARARAAQHFSAQSEIRQLRELLFPTPASDH